MNFALDSSLFRLNDWQMSQTECEYLSLKEVSSKIGLSQSMIKNLIRSGKLKAYRPKRKLLVAIADLDAFMLAVAYEPKTG